MKKNAKKLLALTLSSVLTGLLVMGGLKPAFAAGASSSSLAAGVSVKPRVNNAVSMGSPLDAAAKGAKVFGADSSATLVVDEKGVAPSNGGLASVEISYLVGSGSSACYLMVFDSSVAADTTEAGAVARMLVPPLMVVPSELRKHEFIYPKQFQKGLVVLVGGAGAANCRASVSWIRNGGAD